MIDCVGKSVSHLLEDMIEYAQQQDSVSIGGLVMVIGRRSLVLGMIFFALLDLLPISILPGFSTIISLPILIFAVQFVVGGECLWLPAWVKRREINKRKLIAGLTKTLPYFKKIERVIKPRLCFISDGVGGRVIGIVIIILVLLLMLPIFLSNFIFGFLIIVLAIGLLNKDGLAILIGVIASAMYCAIIINIALIIVQRFF